MNEQLMARTLGNEWEKFYPKTLSEAEKAEIKSALSEKLRSGKTSLRTYLMEVHFVNEYPVS